MCKTSSSDYYARAGNAANVSVLVASLVYVGVVIHYTQRGSIGVLDEDWKEDGFCIHNKNVPFRSSFDACLYVDVFFSAVLGVLYWNWRDSPGMKTASDIVPMSIVGTLAHGMAHGAMAVKFRDGRYEEEKAQGDTPETQPFPQMALFCALFWFPLLKASMPKMNSSAVAMMAAAAGIGPNLAGGLRKQLGFAYIQTVINTAALLAQLSLPAKEKQRREYMTLPLVIVVSLLAAWNEALFCSSYFKSAGGHVWYDVSIILGYTVFYVDCYRFNVLSSTKLRIKGKTM